MSYQLVDPQSVLTFSHDWSTWLAYTSPADTIASQQWSITPLNGTSPETPTLADDDTATVTVSGLVAGRIYRLTEHIVTTAGLEEDRTIVLRCENNR